METPEALSARLESLDDLHSVVTTMKSLAAVSIRQYEQAVEALRGYTDTVETGIRVVLRDTGPGETAGAEASATGIIVFGSDHGLCGRFNEDLAAHVETRLAAFDPGTPVHRLYVGARPAALLEADGGASMENVLATPVSAAQIGPTVEDILERIDHWQRQAGVGRVHLFHQATASTTRSEPNEKVLLPVERGRFEAFDPRTWPGRSRPTYTADRRALLAELFRQYLFVSLFRACAESLAAENGSRLAAMQAAESNVTERIGETEMAYRRARQEAITGELLDVVSGFEALTRPGGGRGSDGEE